MMDMLFKNNRVNITPLCVLNMKNLETVIKKFCKSNAGKVDIDFSLFKNPEDLYKQFGTGKTSEKFLESNLIEGREYGRI